MFLRSLADSMVGSSSHKNILGNLFSKASFKVGTREDHIILNAASKKNFGAGVAQCLAV